jgi:hypothetical protein
MEKEPHLPLTYVKFPYKFYVNGRVLLLTSLEYNEGLHLSTSSKVKL